MDRVEFKIVQDLLKSLWHDLQLPMYNTDDYPTCENIDNNSNNDTRNNNKISGLNLVNPIRASVREFDDNGKFIFT